MFTDASECHYMCKLVSIFLIVVPSFPNSSLCQVARDTLLCAVVYRPNRHRHQIFVTTPQAMFSAWDHTNQINQVCSRREKAEWRVRADSFVCSSPQAPLRILFGRISFYLYFICILFVTCSILFLGKNSHPEVALASLTTSVTTRLPGLPLTAREHTMVRVVHNMSMAYIVPGNR